MLLGLTTQHTQNSTRTPIPPIPHIHTHEDDSRSHVSSLPLSCLCLGLCLCVSLLRARTRTHIHKRLTVDRREHHAHTHTHAHTSPHVACLCLYVPCTFHTLYTASMRLCVLAKRAWVSGLLLPANAENERQGEMTYTPPRLLPSRKGPAPLANATHRGLCFKDPQHPPPHTHTNKDPQSVRDSESRVCGETTAS